MGRVSNHDDLSQLVTRPTIPDPPTGTSTVRLISASIRRSAETGGPADDKEARFLHSARRQDGRSEPASARRQLLAPGVDQSTSREEHIMQTTNMASHGSDPQIRRIGPIGQLVRVFGAVIMALFAFDWLEAGLTWFGEPSTPGNPGVWVVTGLAAYYGLHQLPENAFGRPWGERVLAIAGGVLVVTAVVTLGIHGDFWAPPLTTALYGVDLAFLFVVSLSYLVAVFLRTPGCEVGGLGELVRRLRGVPDPTDHEAMWCIAGIHHLDQWEESRRQPTGH
jgi:hypothetical protein